MRISSVKWEINDTCNLHCKYCMAERGSEELSFNAKCAVIDKLHTMEVKHIDFFGKEPLFNDDIFKLMRYSQSNKYKFLYTFITNGVNLKHFEKDILSSPISGFTVSYDGGTGGRDFVVDLEYLPIFVRNNISVEITVDVHTGNANKICEFLQQFEDLRLTSAYINPITPIGDLAESIKNNDSISSEKYIEVIEEIIRYKNKVPNLDIYVYIPFDYPKIIKEILLLPIVNKVNFLPDDKCFAGVDSMFISSSGIVYGCVNTYYNGIDKYSCDFLNTPIPDILTSIKATKYRQCVVRP